MRHVKIREFVRVRGSVVERVPDKNEVHGSIPCAPTNERFLDIAFRNDARRDAPAG